MKHRTLITACFLFLTEFLLAQPGAVSLSIQYMQQLKAGENTRAVREALAALSEDDLARDLAIPDRQYTFWVNLYNATVQDALRRDSCLYQDRDAFYSEARVRLAGQYLSLEDIEHGILRRSSIKYSLGYLSAWFISDFERRFRVSEVDARIHFVLNCGARSCPPLRILYPHRAFRQMERATREYLRSNSEIKGEEIWVTPLMSWFRGDFGDRIAFLKAYGVLPADSDLDDLEYLPYDWTLSLGDWAEED